MALRALRAWRTLQQGRGVGVGRAELPPLCRGMCINQDTGNDCEGFIEEHLVRGWLHPRNVIRLAWLRPRGGAADRADVTISECRYPSVVSQPLILAT